MRFLRSARLRVFLSLISLGCCSGIVQAQRPARLVHVFVALADNAHQGIVPVPAAVEGWIAGESGERIRERAAVAYAKYQKTGLAGARRLFATGW